MINTQKGSVNIVLAILVVVLVIAVIYLALAKKPASLPQAQVSIENTQPANTQKAPTVATVAKSSTTTETSNTYTYPNAQFHFQVQLPSNAPAPEGNQQGNGDTNFFYRARGSGDLKYLSMISVGTRDCASTSDLSTNTSNAGTILINGVSFVRTAGANALGGMQSNSSDGYYCTSYNGLTYTVAFSDQYGRTAAVPAASTLWQEFDREMKNLSLQFTN